jgi:hypothetical protein
MCYILCMDRTSVYIALGVQGGKRGVEHPLSRGIVGGRGNTLEFCFLAAFCIHVWGVFRHMVFADGFLFTVKELGLLTNPGYWIRVLDATRSYMYIIL